MADTPPRILLIEDDPDTACLLRETIVDHFGADCVDHRSTVSQGLAVELDHYDLVLSDMNLPDGTGLELVEKLLDRRNDLPVVFVTGEGILENAIKAIRLGAYDYVVKAGDYLFALPVVIEKNLEIHRMRLENIELQLQLERTLEQVKVKNEQLEEAVHKLETMAATDPLTGLANRRAFGQALDRRFADSVRQGHDLACIMVDLDGFKRLNDTLGHQKGDQMLQLASKVLQANCRRSDVAGRFGGDEFVLLLPQSDEPSARQVAQRVAEQFTAAAEADLAASDQALRLTMSMGLATRVSSRASSAEQLVAHADHALYSAKAAGKTRLMVYAGPSQAAAAGR